MKSIGDTLKEIRLKKKISIAKLSEITKIKSEFIRAIENGEWVGLPEFPVVMGFVKNIAASLDMKPLSAAALLKRDYPPKSLNINPKPDVAKEFVWSPRLTFLVGVILVAVTLSGYLIYQYTRFISPPVLVVEEPIEGQVIEEENLMVKGNTDLEASVKVNNQPANLEQDGKFSAEIEVTDSTEEIKVVARSRAGKETVVTRKIEVKIGN